MAWVVLVLAGALEAVWAIALSASQGFRRLRPTLVFLVGLACSMIGLAWAMRTLPPGTSYAVWVGVGAALTAVISMARGEDAVTWPRVLLLTVLIGSVVGLQAVS